MAGSKDLFLLGIGYRHVKGGEDDFAKAGQKVKESGKEAAGSVEALEGAMESLKEGFRDAVSEAAGLVTAVVSIHAAIDGVVEGVKLFAEFDEQMARLRGLSSATGVEFGELGDAARKMAAETAEFSAADYSKGLQVLVKSGLSVKEAIGQLPNVYHLAIVGQLQFAESADALATSINRFHQPASEMGHIVDVLTTSTKLSRASVQDIVDTMRQAGPAAGNAGIHFDDLASALTVVAKNAGGARASGGALLEAISVLSNPTKELVFNLGTMGLKIGQLNPQTHSLTQIIQEFAKHGLDAGTAMAIFGRQGGTAILSLVKNLPQLLQVNAAMRDNAGAGRETAEVMENHVKDAYEDMVKAVDAVKLSVGAGLSESLKDGADKLRDVFLGGRAGAEAFGQALGKVVTIVVNTFVLIVEHGREVASVLVGLGVAIAVVKLGPAIAAVWSYVAAFGALAIEEGFVAVATAELQAAWTRFTASLAENPIGAVAIALGLLVAVVYELWQAHKDDQKAAEEYHRELASGKPVIEGVTYAYDELLKKMREELQLRDELTGKVKQQAAELAGLKPLLAQAEVALGSGNDAGYQKAISDAQKLGAVFSDFGKESKLEQLQDQVKLLAAEVEAGGKRIVEANDNIGTSQDRLKQNIATAVSDEVHARTAQAARLADLNAKVVAASQSVKELQADFSGGGGGSQMLEDDIKGLEQLKSSAEAAQAGLDKITKQLQALAPQARAAAKELFSQGKFDQGAAVAAGVGASPQEIATAITEWKSLIAVQDEKRKKDDDAQKARDAAVAKQREYARLHADEILAFGKEVRVLDLSIAGWKRVEGAYGSSYLAGLQVTQQIEDQGKAVQAGSKYHDAMRATIEKLTLSQLAHERAAKLDAATMVAYLAFSQKVRDAAAKETDALDGNNVASTNASRATEVEAFQIQHLLSANDSRLRQYSNMATQRDKELRYYDLKAQADVRDYEWTVQERTAVAAVADARAGDAQASRDLATALEIEARIRSDGAKGNKVAMDAIAVEVIGRRSEIQALNDQAAAEKALTTLRGNAQVANVTAAITTTNNSMRQVETEAIQFIQQLGAGSLKEGQRLFEELAKKEGVTVGQLTDELRNMLQQVDDANKAATLRGGGKTALDVYKEERAEIERLMSSSSGRVLVTEADGLKALHELQQNFLNTQLSAWSSILGTLSQEFGGVFTELLRFVQIIQEINELQQNVGTIISGFTSTVGAVSGSADAVALTGSATALSSSAAAITTSSGGSQVALTTSAQGLVVAANALVAAATALSAAATAQGGAAGVQATSSAVSTGATVVGAGAAGAGAGAAAAGAGAGAAGAGAGAAGASAGFLGIPVVGWVIAAVILVVSVAANWAKAHASTRAQGDLALEKGKFVLDNLKGAKEMTGRLGETITAIGKSLNDYVDQLGIEVTDMAGKLGVTRSGRNKSNEFRVYYTQALGAQLVKNFGRDADAAMQDAFYEALAHSTLATKTGTMPLDPIVLAAVKGAAARAADSMVAGMTDAEKKAVSDAFDKAVADSQEVASLGKPDFVATERQSITHFDDLRATMISILGPSKELVTALSNIGAAELQMWQAERDQLTGREKTRAEQLADAQNNAKIYNAELALRILNVQGAIADIETQKASIVAHATGTSAIIDYTNIYVKSLSVMGEATIGFAIATGAAAGVLSDAQQKQLDMLNQEEKGLQDLLDGLKGIKPIDPSEIKLPGSTSSSSTASDRASFRDELQKDAEVNLPQAVLAVIDLGRSLADLTKRAHDLKIADTELAAAKQALIDQAKGQIKDPIRDFLDPSQGGTYGMGDPQKAMADVHKTFDDARAANAKLIKDTGQRAVAFWQLNQAEARAAEKVVQDTIAGLGLPIDQTTAKAKGMADTMATLTQWLNEGSLSAEQYATTVKQLSDQASIEILGMVADLLEQAGRFDDADKLRRAQDEINFHIQLTQLNILYNSYVALGYISGALKDKLDPLVAWINDPNNWPNFDLPAPERGSGGDNSTNDQLQADATRRQEILDQIKAWEDLGKSDTMKGLQDLHDTLVSMSADAQRLGISLTELVAANANAVEDFWNKALAPYESGATTSLFDQVAAVEKTFDDMIAAAKLYGGDQQRILADEAAAVAKFWDDALKPIRDEEQKLKLGQVGDGLSPEQKLAAAQAQFNTLATAALGGDASAVAALPDAIQALLDQQKAYSGTGPAYQALVATIQGVLDQIFAFGGAAAAGAGAAPASSVAAAPLPTSLLPSGSVPAPAPRPVAAPTAGSASPAPIPLPDGGVNRLADAIEDDVKSRQGDKGEVADLRTQVDRLLRANQDLQGDVVALTGSVKRLASLVETQERRFTVGRKP